MKRRKRSSKAEETVVTGTLSNLDKKIDGAIMCGKNTISFCVEQQIAFIVAVEMRKEAKGQYLVLGPDESGIIVADWSTDALVKLSTHNRHGAICYCVDCQKGRGWLMPHPKEHDELQAREGKCHCLDCRGVIKIWQ